MLSGFAIRKAKGEQDEKNQKNKKNTKDLKGTQFKLTNLKNAGGPAIRDKGIRHTRREEIIAPRTLHLTIKLIRADVQNKTILKGLRHAILRARFTVIYVPVEVFIRPDII
jgi:hypothetical protein